MSVVNYVSPELTFLMTNSSRCLRTRKKTRRTIAENLHHLFYRMEFTETDALTEALAFKKLPMYKEASLPGSMAHTKRYVNDLLPDGTVLRVSPRDTLMGKLSIVYIYGPWVPDASLNLMNIGMGCDWKPVEIHPAYVTQCDKSSLLSDYFGEPHDWDSLTHIDVWN